MLACAHAMYMRAVSGRYNVYSVCVCVCVFFYKFILIEFVFILYLGDNPLFAIDKHCYRSSVARAVIVNIKKKVRR